MDAQAIYNNFHKYDRGTQGLSAAQQIAQQLSVKYQGRATTTQQMVNGIRAGWRGNAAEAASQGLAPFAENALNNHQQLNTGQDIVSRQIDSFHTAAAEVRPVPPAPQLQNVITAVMSGQDPQPMIAQIMAHQAIQQSNVDAYNKYVGASRYNTSNLPEVTALDKQSAPVTVTPPAPSAQAAGTVTPRVIGGGRRTTQGGTPTSSATTSDGGSLSQGAPSGGGPVTTASAAPPSVSGPPPPAAPPWTAPGAGSSPVPADGGLVAPIPPAGTTNGEPIESGMPGAREIGIGGVRSGSGSSLVRGQPTVDGAPAEQGGRIGTAASEEPALAAERGSVVPEAMAGPMSGSHGDDDHEHRRKYDYGDDPEELFAGTEKVAPPVFGETAAERAARYADQAGQHRADG